MLQKGIITPCRAREIALISCFSPALTTPKALQTKRKGSDDAKAKRMSEQNRIQELETAVAQLETALREAGGINPPPPHLQRRVVRDYSPGFLDSGYWVLDELESALQFAGRKMDSFANILDFGCGCGRVTRALYYRRKSRQGLYASDLDPEAIAWCQENYGNLAEFSVNNAEPPLAYADSTFDLVLSVSIFTHLPEDMQFRWLDELSRVTKPDGFLILSVHGGHHIRNATAEIQEEVRQRGFFYQQIGQVEGLPEFYQNAYHSLDYIRAQWGRYFDVLHIVESLVGGHQDAVLCRKRGAHPA